MDCKMFSSMIDDYLDDALPEEQRALFLAHAAECKICQSKLEHAQNMLEALQGRACMKARRSAAPDARLTFRILLPRLSGKSAGKQA